MTASVLRLSALLTAALLFSACATQPAQTTATTAPAPVSTEPSLGEPLIMPGVFISPPRYGDTSVGFMQSRNGEPTFPPNQIGANLTFTSNLRMPKLEAVDLGEGRFQLRIRFSNASKEPLMVTLACLYSEVEKPAQKITQINFPVNTFRDIALDLEGDVARKLTIQAYASAEK